MAAKRKFPRPAPEEAAPETAVREDDEAFRLRLIRAMVDVSKDWRRCPEPACRRTRRCVAPDMPCVRSRKPRPMTPDQRAQAAASMRRALDRRLAECEAQEAQEAQEANARAAPPAPATPRPKPPRGP